MSAETRAALDAAIEAHLTDVTQGIVTEWVLYAAAIAPDCDDHERWYHRVLPNGQPTHATLGLLNKATIEMEEGIRELWKHS